MIITTPGAGRSLDDIYRAGLGYATWTFNPNGGSGGTAPTQGTIYAMSCPYRAGQVITNTVWLVSTGGTVSSPTSIFTGICSAAGVMQAQSGNDKNNTVFTTSTLAGPSPLSGQWTVPADGLYYNVIIQVGAWGGTQMALVKNVQNAAPGGISVVAFGTGGTTGQTVLPANGQSIAGGIVSTNGIAYFSGAN